MRRRRAILVLVAGIGLAPLACTSGEQATSTDAGPTAAPTTTSTSASPPTDAPRPLLTTQARESPNATDPAGSGCTPDRPPDRWDLPDGQWFGRLEYLPTDGGSWGLVLSCLYTGEAGANVAAASGDMFVNNYVRVDGTGELYPLTSAGDESFTAYFLAAPGSSDYAPPVIGYEAARPRLDAWEYPFDAWVVIEDGQLVLLQQQFFP